MSTNQLDDLYRDIILDHYRSPRGKKPLEKADVKSDGSNPTCGDEVSLEVELDDGKVKGVHVDCLGCAISVASGSILAELLKGRTVDEAKRIAALVRDVLTGEAVEIPHDLGDLDALQGVRKFPVRIKCALLAWVTFMEGIKKHESGAAGEATVTTEAE